MAGKVLFIVILLTIFIFGFYSHKKLRNKDQSKYSKMQKNIHKLLVSRAILMMVFSIFCLILLFIRILYNLFN